MIAMSYDGVLRVNANVLPNPVMRQFWRNEWQRWTEIASDLLRQGDSDRSRQAFESAAAYLALATAPVMSWEA